MRASIQPPAWGYLGEMGLNASTMFVSAKQLARAVSGM